MKIRIDHWDESIEFQIEKDDQDIHEMVDILERVLVGMGYPPSVVQQGFCSKAEELEEDEQV